MRALVVAMQSHLLGVVLGTTAMTRDPYRIISCGGMRTDVVAPDVAFPGRGLRHTERSGERPTDVRRSCCVQECRLTLRAGGFATEGR